jgi:CheY-like chemotaxis protein
VESNRHLGTGVSWKRSILIVDDEVSILQTPRTAFEHEGYDLTRVEDSVRALELLTGIATLID